MSMMSSSRASKAFQPRNAGTLDPAAEPAAAPPGRTAGFDQKFAYWTNQLFDISKRNKMLNYRETKRSTLRIIEPGFLSLFNRLAVKGEELTFRHPVDMSSDIRASLVISLFDALGCPIADGKGDIKTERPLPEQRDTLKGMRSRSKLIREEQGVDPLYLSFGFVEWEDGDTAGAARLKSPLVMVPVSLNLESVQAPYTIARNDDGDIWVNPVLSYILSERYGVELPAFEADGLESLDLYMRAVEGAVEANGWGVSREVSLGVLMFQKISMYNDLNNNYSRILRHPIIRAMTGDASALRELPAPTPCTDYDLVHPNECYEVLSSDSSQHEAIRLSKAGVSFVLQGPPGTGKSQTIANIIAEALSAGKTVLFVSGKAAALDIVYKRLSEVRLEDFCLALHNHKANKKDVIAGIGDSLNLSRIRVKDSAMSELNELFDTRQSLNRYARELHEKIPPLNKSLYEAFGVLASYNEDAYEPFRIDNIASVTAEGYLEMKRRAAGLSEAYIRLEASILEDPLSEALPARLTGETLWSYADRVMAPLDLLADLPAFPLSWIDEGMRVKLLDTAAERGGLTSRYHAGLQSVSRIFRNCVFDIDMEEWIPAVRAAVDSARGLAGLAELSDEGILNAAPSLTEQLDGIVSKLENLVIAYYELESKTGIVKACTEKNARALSAVCDLLISSPIVPDGWRYKNGLKAAQNLLNDAQNRYSRLISARSDVLGQYRGDILNIDARAYLNRFSGVYNSSVKKLAAGYEKDISLLKALHKGGGLNVSDVLGLLDKLLIIDQLLDEIDKNDSELYLRFPSVYKGVNTDWAAIRGILDQIGREIKMGQSARMKIHKAKMAILQTWDDGVFDLDAEAELQRLESRFDNIKRTVNAKYRKEAERFNKYYKPYEHGRIPTKEAILGLLQDLISISEQEERFTELTQTIAVYFHYLYDGAHTDWNYIQSEFDDISEQYDRVSIIARRINALKEDISQKWNNEALSLDPKDISRMKARFSGVYTDSFHNAMRMYRKDMDMFASMKLTAREEQDDEAIIRVLRQISLINDTINWFDNTAFEALSGAFGDDYNGMATDWGAVAEKISFMASLFDTLACVEIPAEIGEIICGGKPREKALSEISGLSDLMLIDTLQETMTAAQLYVPVTPYAVIEDELLPDLYEWQSKLSALTVKLKALSDCSIDGVPSGSVMRLAEEIQSCNNLKQEIGSFAETDKALLGGRYMGADTDWGAVVSDIRKISAFLEAPESRLFMDGFIAPAGGDMAMGGDVSAFAALLRNLSKAKALCFEEGLSDFVDKMEQPGGAVKNAAECFEYGFYSAWTVSVIGKHRSVGQFKRDIQDEKIGRFASMDADQLLIARERVRQRVIDRMPDVYRARAVKDELSVFEGELRKKVKVMPLRRLFASIPNLLQKLKPCLMMSPLSVAYFLESGAYEFDLVIFDEASQIFPQDAIGAIFRGKQLIVAGDSRQLPPTNFFRAAAEYEYDVGDEYGEGRAPELFDSILDEAADILPDIRLLWHYRSKHENLIAFSNQNFYQNALITFPGCRTAAADSGVEFVYVEDGVYEGWGVNTREARRCVGLIKEHIETRPERSLGVVAFSQKQQYVILDELDRFRQRHPEYESFFDEGKEDAFFVKNLESVQGDERDTIIFSVSYAKTWEQREKDRHMWLYFGPLSEQGGERRLNVAISRARYNIKLVSSILPSDIDLRRTESVGIRMLRSYIEFAMKGVEALHAPAPGGDAFSDAVGQFIVSHGYKINKNLGCSAYKIDVAVIHPENGSYYAAGIECDGPLYASAKTARDRDHLRKSVLEAMGWNMYRCWSAEWMSNPSEEGGKLLAFIENAIANSAGGARADSEEALKARARLHEYADTIGEEERFARVSSLYSVRQANPYGFQPYVQANWRDTPHIRDYKGAERIAEEILYIVGVEQPIHIKLLYQRMAGAFGGKTFTKPMMDYVDKVIARMLKDEVKWDREGFLTLVGFDDLKVRVPPAGAAARRMEWVSYEEVSLALYTIASYAIGVYAADLIDATVRGLGFREEGAKIYVSKILNRMVSEGRLALAGGKVMQAGGRVS